MDKVFDKWTFARFQKVLSLAFGVCMLSFTLTACSSDETAGGSAEEEGIIASETFDELPKCTEEREGVTAYVKKDKAGYVCKDGDWVPDIAEESSDSDEEVSSSSYSGEGDSESSASDNDISSSSQTKREIIVINDKSITGVSQKGPFVTGSAVKLYELDGKSLAQTGKSFTGKISSDKGEFSVSSVSLSSQYALLEASGYYRNEVTGNKSSGTIVLNALTDLSDREKVNVNLLTHLEYERALYLLETGINVPAAKKQAEAEVFNAFGIQGDFANSEDLSIFSSGEGDAALLAFSVLILGDNSEADLTELMNKFATDIKEDGEWTDEATKAKIADWASAKDLNGGLEIIKSNINGWSLGTAPNFEKYVRDFWYVNYGLGDCSKTREGEVAADSNTNSTNYYENSPVRYICKSGAWIEASDIEKDTYGWAAGEDGEIKLGDITQSKYYDYDGAEKAWRTASAVERMLGGCSETREADISLNTGKVNGTWYICRSREWESTSNITVDTQGWVEGSDGDLKKGDSTDVMYKYDEALDQWVETSENDVNLKLMGCTTNRTGEIGQSGETYYVCKNGYWQEAEEIDYDTYGEKCTSADVGKVISGKVKESNKYYCSANGWVSLMDWRWDVPKEARLNPEIAYDSITDSRDGQTYKIVKIGDQVWMAENLNYADSNQTPSLKGKSWCYVNNEKYCEVTGRLYTWAAAIDSVALANDADNPQTCGYGTKCTLPATVRGICPDGWHLPSLAEWKKLLEPVSSSVDDHTTWWYYYGVDTMLKTGSGWYDSDNGNDYYGFSVLPAGYSDNYGRFKSAGRIAYFWSGFQDERNYGDAYSVSLIANENTVGLGYYDEKDYALSIRCVKDSD